MKAIATRWAALPPRRQASGGIARLLRRLSALAIAAADRLTSPQRDVPPESYRFPPF